MDWRELIFPELKQFPVVERASALAQARQNDFDWLEKLGIIAALTIVSALVGKLEIPWAPGDRFAFTLFLFVISIPLLAMTAGTFMVRRTRRGLRNALQERHP